MSTDPNPNPVTAALPGGGWHAVYRNDDGTEARYPVAAWLIHADGSGYACEADGPDLLPISEVSNLVRLDPPKEN